MNTIKWTGRDTRGICKWTVEATSMIDLYNQLVDKGVISRVDGDPYVMAKVEKEIEKSHKWKDYRDFEEQIFNDDPEDDPMKVYNSLLSEMEDLTDDEIMQVILKENGNAYYQTFEFED